MVECCQSLRLSTWKVPLSASSCLQGWHGIAFIVIRSVLPVVEVVQLEGAVVGQQLPAGVGGDGREVDSVHGWRDVQQQPALYVRARQIQSNHANELSPPRLNTQSSLA